MLGVTLPRGRTPPVLPDYLDLSVGGTLSVGGVGGTTWRLGVVSDHVLELEVVTGRGETFTCSPTENTSSVEDQQSAPGPDADLRNLERLVGTWRVTGGAAGHVTYRWLEGGFFLAQDFDLEQDGQQAKGLEVIGREKEFGAEQPSSDIKSRIYDTQGNTFSYVYELEGDTLTIWAGEKGSPAYYRGTFSDDGNAVDGEWVYPGGGGYASTMTRVS